MRIYDRYELLGLEAMNDFSLTPGRTALVVVDMQYGSVHRDFGFQKLYRSIGMGDEVQYFQDRIWSTVVPNIQALLIGFRGAGARVIYLTVGSEREDYGDFCARRIARIRFWQSREVEVPYPRAGMKDLQVLSELVPHSGEPVINKTTASAFNSSDFDWVLRQAGLDTLVVAGVGTNYCVEMTFRDASDRGYLCCLAEDACATSTPEMHVRAVDTMRFYGRVESTRAILEELTVGGKAEPPTERTSRP